MPYVRRNESGQVVSVHREPSAAAPEEIPAEHPDLLEFIGTAPNPTDARSYLARTDAELVRVIEDLIDLLVDKGVILFTDLPETAQKKLTLRRDARRRMRTEAPMVVEPEDIL